MFWCWKALIWQAFSWPICPCLIAVFVRWRPFAFGGHLWRNLHSILPCWISEEMLCYKQCTAWYRGYWRFLPQAACPTKEHSAETICSWPSRIYSVHRCIPRHRPTRDSCCCHSCSTPVGLGRLLVCVALVLSVAKSHRDYALLAEDFWWYFLLIIAPFLLVFGRPWVKCITKKTNSPISAEIAF